MSDCDMAKMDSLMSQEPDEEELKQRYKISKLTKWDFPNVVPVQDGYYVTEKIVTSDANFRLLVEEHNKLVDIVTFLLERANYEESHKNVVD